MFRAWIKVQHPTIAFYYFLGGLIAKSSLQRSVRAGQLLDASQMIPYSLLITLCERGGQNHKEEGTEVWCP